MRRRSGRRSVLALVVLVALVVGVTAATQGVSWWQRERQASVIVAEARPGDIHMLSSLTCVYCAQARAWFTEHQVPFSECMIENDTLCATKYRALMAPGTPVLLVRGKPLVGFNVPAIAGALAARPASTTVVPQPPLAS